MMNNASLLSLEFLRAWGILCFKLAEHGIDLSVWIITIGTAVSIWACGR